MIRIIPDFCLIFGLNKGQGFFMPRYDRVEMDSTIELKNSELKMS